MKYDTSPYRYDGVEDPYSFYAVEQFNEDEVEDFNEYDSIFGIGGGKKKRAERKLARAEKKLSKGRTRAAARLQGKAAKLLGKVAEGQATQQAVTQQLADVNANQQVISEDLTAVREEPQIKPMSVQPMSSTGSDVYYPEQPMYSPSPGGGGGGGGMSELSYLPGVESTAPYTSEGAEPTGNLAAVKTLPEVTVSGSKTKLLLILAGVVLLVLAIVYFSKKRKK